MICKVITTNFEFISLNFQFSTMADLLDIAKLKDLLDADLPITDIASALGVSRQTIYNKMRRMAYSGFNMLTSLMMILFR